MDQLTLLPYYEDMEEYNTNLNDKLKRLNIIMKLNNEQILSILSDYSNKDIKLRAVVKDGKIIGLRKVINDDRKKVEIIKCNSVKENIGNLYHLIHGSTNVINLGPLDYRLNLINYKPVIDNDNIENISKLRDIVKIVEFIIFNNNRNKDKDRDNNFLDIGIKYDKDKVIQKFPQCQEILESLKPIGHKEDLIDWKWMEFIRSFNNIKWMKKLFIQGYRPNDAYSMLYTGRVDPGMIVEKNKDKDDTGNFKEVAVYNSSDSGPTSPIISNSSKSSISSHNTFSRSVTNSSNTTPEKEREREVKEVKEIKRKSFKEYQMAKKLEKPKGTDEIKVMKRKREEEQEEQEEQEEKTGNNNEIKKIPKGPKINELELVKSYQKKYIEYYKLYQILGNVDISNIENEDKINLDIKKLIDMQNELEEIRWKLIT
jgi:hypothetical protein